MPLLFLIALLLPLHGHAADELYAQVEGSVVSVYLSATANANAIEGTLVLPQGVTGEELLTGESVVLHWLELPTIKEGAIRFAGVIPGGFSGTLGAPNTDGLVLSVRVGSNAVGARLLDAFVYQNDGSGTRIAVAESRARLGASRDVPEDTVAPEWMDATRLTQDGRTLLVLSAVDKGSGIAYFEVAEGFGAWIQTGNPYELNDTHGLFFARARAVDNAGNMRESVVFPKPIPLTIYSVIIVLIGLLYFIQYRRRHS